MEARSQERGQRVTRSGREGSFAAKIGVGAAVEFRGDVRATSLGDLGQDTKASGGAV